MSPEIILCIPFGLQVDIFSFGIILLELVLGIVADTTIDPNRPTVHPLFERIIPGFGVNEEDIKEAAPPDCPPAFLELALNCAHDDPEKRPTTRDILKRLRGIEFELSAQQTRNIGLMTGISCID
jgi:LIM domain kinase 1